MVYVGDGLRTVVLPTCRHQRRPCRNATGRRHGQCKLPRIPHSIFVEIARRIFDTGDEADVVFWQFANVIAHRGAQANGCRR